MLGANQVLSVMKTIEIKANAKTIECERCSVNAQMVVRKDNGCYDNLENIVGIFVPESADEYKALRDKYTFDEGYLIYGVDVWDDYPSQGEQAIYIYLS